MTQLPKMYTQSSADPLISGVMGYAGESNDFIWFKTFLFVEAWVLHLFLSRIITLLPILQVFPSACVYPWHERALERHVSLGFRHVAIC